MKLEITDIKVENGNTSYYCGDSLIFSTPTLVPVEFLMSQEQWDDMRRVCAEDRVKQGWIGNDILHPVPWDG